MFFWLGTIARTIKFLRKLSIPLIRYSRIQKAYLASDSSSKISIEESRHAAGLLKAILEMGPTFIKFGQILATRPDILPPLYLQGLSTLHDEVPPAPRQEIKKQIEEELGPINEVFESFEEEPIASASLGQVHRAVLQGREVAVKINRPKIKELVTMDLWILKRFSPFLRLFMEEYQVFLIKTIITSFSKTIFDEMDYKLEADNLLRIRRNLADEKDVIVPNVLLKYSTSRVLVMEYVSGIKITNIAAIERAGIDRKDLAKRVSTLYLDMLIEHDIFQADPHPGNISVKEDGRLVLYDYGMVGSIDSLMRKKILRLYFAIVIRDPDKVMNRMIDLGLLDSNADAALVRRGIELSLHTWEGKGINRTGLSELVSIANSTLHSYPVHLTSDLAQIVKISEILAGVCSTVDPEFNFIENVFEFQSRTGHLESQVKEEVDEMVDDLWNSLLLMPKLPRMVYNFLNNYNVLFETVISPPGKIRMVLSSITGFLTLGLILYFIGNDLILQSILTAAFGSSITTAAILWRRPKTKRMINR